MRINLYFIKVITQAKLLNDIKLEKTIEEVTIFNKHQGIWKLCNLKLCYNELRHVVILSLLLFLWMVAGLCILLCRLPQWHTQPRHSVARAIVSFNIQTLVTVYSHTQPRHVLRERRHCRTPINLCRESNLLVFYIQDL